MIENEDDDSVGSLHDQEPEDRFAAAVGITRAGDKLDANVLEFAFRIVALCAAVGDQHIDGEAGGNAGEHTREMYMPLR